MEPSWFVGVDAITLPLSDGHSIQIRKRLNTALHRAHLKRSRPLDQDGQQRFDSLEAGLSIVLAYLLAWSLPEFDIRGLSDGENVRALKSVVDNLDPDRFSEIKAAIEDHDNALEAARAEEKKTRASKTSDAAILPSPSEPDGKSIGSETLIPMTT